MEDRFQEIVEAGKPLFGQIEAIKAMFALQIAEFCDDHGEPHVIIRDLKLRYNGWQNRVIALSAEVLLADVPEKEQVPRLRKLEAAWPKYRGPLTYQTATYHPTSKHYSRRLKLESNIQVE